jgi:hypothetical protein
MVSFVDSKYNHQKSQTQHKTLGAFGYKTFPAYKSCYCSNGPVQSEFNFYELLSTKRNNKNVFYGLSRVHPNIGTHTLHAFLPVERGIRCICYSSFVSAHVLGKKQ